MPSSDPHEHGDHDDHDDHDGHDHDHSTQHATSSELSAAAVTGLPLLDYDAAAAQLTRSNLKWEDGNSGNGSGVGASATVTYGYLLQSGNLNNPALNADEIENFELIVSMIEDIADIEFTRVTDAGSDYIVSASSVQIDIRGIAGTNGGVTNYSYFGSTLISASVATGTHKLDTIGDFAFATAIHELAHALGVLHPGDYDGSVTEDDKAYYQDSQQYSLMSYFSEADSGADFGNGYFYENGGFVEGSRAPSAPMLHDIAALQRLYGANTTTRTGDSTYGWNSNLGHGVWSVTDYKQIPMGAIWDQGGVDTIDASGYLSDSVIDLREEGFSSFGTYEAGGYGPPFNNEAIVHNVAIARGVKIENAVGGVGDDLLIGNSADASHSDADGTGYSGNNTLDGGGGTNTVSYAAGVEGVDIDLSLGGAGAGGHTYALGENGNDRLINIQNLIGSAFADTLGAAAGGGVLEGGAGDDILTGGAGNDTLDGGAGSDLVDYGDASGGLTIDLSLGGGDAGGHAYALAGEGTDTLRNIEGLIGSGFADDLTLGAAGGTLRGGAGNDSLTGGSGSDTADYSDATAALAIDLTLGGATAGGHTYALGSRGNDTLRNIDNLIGGAFDDVLTLASTGGTLEGGAGADSLIGGNGTDTASYANAAAGVSLDVLSPGGFTGDAAGDVFVSIEGVLGSAHADTLRGHSGVDILSGGSGVDTLIGRGSLDSLLGGEGNDVLLGGGGTDVLHGGAGADFMRGDAGIDRVLYVTAAEAVRVDLSDMALNTGEAEGDNIQLVENIDGSDHHDDLRGDTGDNYLRGRDGNDTLRGRGGDDTLEGGRGADVLLGQGGADHFRFTGPNQGVDTINDFEIGIDSIDVLGSAFGGLPTGTLAAGRFFVGTSAGDADDRFIYNDANGRLFYDADGTGGGAAKLLTVLAGAPLISASDIEVV